MTESDGLRTILEAPLNRDKGADSLQRQLYLRLRQAILQHEFVAGCRLPGSRSLAENLSISRNTVLSVYEQLTAEGFLLADRRGTIVAQVAYLPTVPVSEDVVTMSHRVELMRADMRKSSKAQLFRVGIPALSHFPMSAWRKALELAMTNAPVSALNYGDPLGEITLRKEIANHLAVSRGIRCRAEQVVITDGAQAALNLCVQLFSNPGDIGWIENPGYQGARTVMRTGELQLHPIQVDGLGMVIDPQDWTQYPPRLIYSTPSHQYPTGGVLSIQRRLSLLQQAKYHHAWIIEDDYDSEYRHCGQPVVAMQGLVDDPPVLYVGSFSKTMFPSLRLGYLVLPERVMQQQSEAIANLLRGGNIHTQLGLAIFIQSGQYSRHLTRMRKLYRERQSALRTSLERYFPIPHEILGGAAGLHLTIRLPEAYPDRHIVEQALQYGIAASALSAFACNDVKPQNGLVLGYGNTSADQYESVLQRLGQIAIHCYCRS